MKLSPGHMQLIDADRPVMQSGRLQVSVAQSITTDEGDETLRSSFAIAIDGHRFSLLPDDVYSVSPAPGSPPGFHGVLPHVVLSRSTLPWERSIASDEKAPWLCVIVLSERDASSGPLPSPVTGQVSDLLHAPGDIRLPKVDLTDGIETANDPCRYLDVDTALAHRVLPRRSDLPWLAHVRAVRTDRKETWSHLTDGRFAVLTANRVPPGPTPDAPDPVATRCYIVSLDGHGGALDKEWAVDAAQIRFAVLGEWAFDVGPDDPFRAAMLSLDPKPGSQDDALLRPHLPARFTANDPAHKAVQNATHRGFAALRHRTRVGVETISWYQGPLTPGPTRGGLPEVATTSADQYLSYDPETGMLDASYAAAWQLGRLLALKNKGFAASVMRLRHDIARSQSDRAFAQDLRQSLTRDHSGPLADMLPELPEIKTVPDYPIDDAIQTALARFALLYGVPLEYILPHPSLIGDNAIRFFRLDLGWVAALLDGCLSIGRVRGARSVADDHLQAWITEHLVKAAHQVRSPDAGTMPQPFGAWTVTGYLLRSDVVPAWLGLESEVATDLSQNAVPLRIDRLAPDLLLCLVEGQISRLTIHEPPEGLHFGFDEVTPDFKLILRGPPKSPDAAVKTPLAFAAGTKTDNGRLDMAKLADAIGQVTGTQMSSAILAHYLIQSPLMVTFSDDPTRGAK